MNVHLEELISAAVGHHGTVVLKDFDYDAMLLEICRLREVERQLAELAGEEHY
jgi:hypothetical protein